ncbi:MAG: glycerophosphodiester phosphodiesterase family protein [Actinomycetota bacterium]
MTASRRALDHPYLHHPDLPDGAPIAFAHRGGTDVAPENTVAAFDHAVALGYRYLETDVHRTLDGELVAFHDRNLSRTSGVDALISDLTAAEIDDVRIDGEHRIPRLSELFERFPTVHFNIDAKADDAVEPLAEIVRRYEAIDRVCLAAFVRSRILRLTELLGPELLTNMSSVEVALFCLGRRTLGDRLRAAQVPVRGGRVDLVTPAMLDRARRRGIPVHVWTINDATETERLLDLGVDGIMTDDVAMLRDAFVARRLWPA